MHGSRLIVNCSALTLEAVSVLKLIYHSYMFSRPYAKFNRHRIKRETAAWVSLKVTAFRDNNSRYASFTRVYKGIAYVLDVGSWRHCITPQRSSFA